ncbi:LysE family translocator [Pseudomonas antarctica]|uniref:LysE family translocator n=1 Tax=Pseudomonas antarctica TaxID=219572 RepID=UPI00345DF465
MTLNQLILFLPSALIVASSPGANNLLAFANGSREGLRPAILALAGRCVAFVFLVAIVIGGLGAVLEASEIAFQIIKWAGVLYLAFLGVKTMMGGERSEGGVSGTVVPVGTYSLVRREFITAMMNPKAILLFTAFVPQFVVADSSVSITNQLLVLSAIYISVELMAATGWALAGSIVRSLHASARQFAIFNRITGVTLLGAAVMLASARRT